MATHTLILADIGTRPLLTTDFLQREDRVRGPGFSDSSLLVTETRRHNLKDGFPPRHWWINSEEHNRIGHLFDTCNKYTSQNNKRTETI